MELKNSMRKPIIDILKDQFLKTREVTNFNTEVFLSKLCSYLVEEMAATTDDFISNHKDQLHEDIVIPKELTAREKDA
jgi:hypothetical protein